MLRNSSKTRTPSKYDRCITELRYLVRLTLLEGNNGTYRTSMQSAIVEVLY